MEATVRPEILDKLTEGIATLTSSDAWRRYLDCQRRFYSYSFSNAMLILIQRSDATRVAGFNTWLKLGRHVRKGERGIAILAPCLYKREVRDEQTDELTERRILRGFRVAHVFDLAQTDGDSLPEVCQRLTGDDPARLFSLLAAFASSLGYHVEREALGDRNGDCHYGLRRIRVHSDVSDRQAVKTMVHELAHAILHEGSVDRARAELEAESVAYLVCAEAGLDTADYSFGYLANWAGGGEEAIAGIRAAGDRIQSAGRQILQVILPSTG